MDFATDFPDIGICSALCKSSGADLSLNVSNLSACNLSIVGSFAALSAGKLINYKKTYNNSEKEKKNLAVD